MTAQSTADFTTTASGTTTSMLDRPRPAEVSSDRGGDARARIHRAAGVVHKTIDNIENRLGSGSRTVMSTPARYGEQARHYGDRLREHIDARPLQSAAVALGAGVVLDKLLTRTPKVRVVRVRVPAAAGWDPMRSIDARARRSIQAAGTHGIQELERGARTSMAKVGAAGGLGLAATKAAASTLAHKAGTVPLQLRLATQRLLARSQAYGSMARSEVQTHPLMGIGAGLGAGALLATLLLRRRLPSDRASLSVDERDVVAWQPDQLQTRSRTRVIASHPVMSAMVMLGLGALVGALLKRH